MGQEITDSHFEPEDFAAFEERLGRETLLLNRWLDEGRFESGPNVGGFELEAWLVDADIRPAGIVEPYLKRLDDPLAVPELATFNVELNGTPRQLQGAALTSMQTELSATWERCNSVAAELDARLAMIGILPTASTADFTLANMSPLHRYHALNEQVLIRRGGEPLRLQVEGRDKLLLEQSDVMLEAAATSFQIHLKVNVDEGVRFYNASKILSAPMVALSANSPYLFGADLWDETRIPLFEQAVAVGDSKLDRRVTFGVRYIEDSIAEYFQTNWRRYPVLLPRLMDEPEESLAHLRLQNGTIWRWNRPLIGFDAENRPHLRIEHRVVPAGPTIVDSIANAAFYFGAVATLSRQQVAPETLLTFEQAQDNFYTAAKHGLRAEVRWLDGKLVGIQELCSKQLMPLAREGLLSMGIDAEEVAHWLGIVQARVSSMQNGAAWQRAWVEKNGSDMQGLTETYLQRQASGIPVHEWVI
ncbi:MAG: glutamate--cysteine ligase [Gammaproteobacteria bacterium]|nr:glutamate--cysteine ligase [Gammaproteobacteria bacterium]